MPTAFHTIFAPERWGLISEGKARGVHDGLMTEQLGGSLDLRGATPKVLLSHLWAGTGQ